MRKFKENRKLDEIISKAKNQGWEVDTRQVKDKKIHRLPRHDDYKQGMRDEHY